MTQPTGADHDTEQARTLLQEYCFDLAGYQPSELVSVWQARLEAEPSWIRAAVIEALYQGRYKAFSVEQILRVWKRRGHPLRHFNNDFERVVCGPIDPNASKYAAMTTMRPSDFLTPQSDSRGDRSESVSDAASVTVTASESPTPAQSSSAPEVSPPPEHLDQATPASSALSPPVSPAPALPPSPPIAYPTSATRPADFSQPQPIRKFTPQPEASEFYYRLQSVARHPF